MILSQNIFRVNNALFILNLIPPILLCSNTESIMASLPARQGKRIAQSKMIWMPTRTAAYLFYGPPCTQSMVKRIT